MTSLMIPLAQELEKGKAYKFGYEIGYFIGSNFWEIMIIAAIVLGLIFYFVFFRKGQRKSTF